MCLPSLEFCLFNTHAIICSAIFSILENDDDDTQTKYVRLALSNKKSVTANNNNSNIIDHTHLIEVGTLVLVLVDL